MKKKCRKGFMILIDCCIVFLALAVIALAAFTKEGTPFTKTVLCVCAAIWAVIFFINLLDDVSGFKNPFPKNCIKIKYFNDEIDKIKKIDNGDWIDLRAAEEVTLKAGEFKLIKLGVAMQLPKGYEAHMVPRSSTYKNFGIIQTNHQAVIDESYCGDNDEWRYPAYALRDTIIHVNDRICQFRIVEKQPEFEFAEVLTLGNEDRGGIGSTGKN